MGGHNSHRPIVKLYKDFEGVAVDLDIAPARSEGSRTVRTFLFSDIVDSTRLSEAMGDAAWEPLLQWHDRTLRAEFERWNGEDRPYRMAFVTVTEFGRMLKDGHGNAIGTQRGDWTDHWTDGPGSSAYETGINRATHETLAAAEASMDDLVVEAAR